MRYILTVIFTCLVVAPSAHAAQSDSNNVDVSTVSATVDLIRAGQPAEAVKKADEVIARFEGGREANAIYLCTGGGADTLAQLMLTRQTLPPGKEKSWKLVAVSSAICSAYFLKGFALVDLGDRPAARANFEIAIAMDSDNTHYLNELAEWYKIEKQWEKSLELFTRASETNDLTLIDMDEEQATKIRDDRQCRSLRGIAFNYVEMREWDKARVAVKKCLAINPEDRGSLQELDYIEELTGVRD